MLIHVKANASAQADDLIMNSDPTAAARRDIELLRARARWYRSWAELAGNEAERQARLRMADHIEAKARASEAREPIAQSS